MNLILQIEYCIAWSYHYYFEQIKHHLEKLIPNCTVEGNTKREPRYGAFEISLDSTILYSKLNTSSCKEFENLSDEKLYQIALQAKDALSDCD